MLEILGKVGFDWQVSLSSLVTFLIILGLLYKFAYDPVKRVLEKRQTKIADGLNQADAAQKALANAEVQAAGVVTGARKEAQEIVSGARSRADETIAASTGKATEQADSIIADAKTRAEKEISDIRGSFSKEASSVVVSAIERLLVDTLTPEQQSQLNAKAVQALSKSMAA